jgi:hypothetical protein
MNPGKTNQLEAQGALTQGNNLGAAHSGVGHAALHNADAP